jgi:CO/xanthine dehydrogenase Mo-binding subunit
MMPTLYHIPNFKYTGIRVVTNRPACGAFRGHGVPHPRFAFECLLTMIAEELGIDPIEIRMRNSMDPNTRTVNDLDIGSCEFRATLDAVREKSGWTCPRVAASASVAAASSRVRATPSTAARSSFPMKRDVNISRRSRSSRTPMPSSGSPKTAWRRS